MFKRFGAGMAVGYVLGARAGQKRYDQISDLAERALEIPFVERLADSGRSMAMDQGRRVLAGLKDRAQWNASDEEDGDGREDEDDGYDAEGYDAESDDEPEDVDDEAEDDEPDDGDDEPEDVDDEADDVDDGDDEPEDVDDEADDDEAEDDEPDDVDDEADDSRASNGHGRRRRGSPKHRIGSLASAARERGRVD